MALEKSPWGVNHDEVKKQRTVISAPFLIIRLNNLGWPQKKIAETTGITRWRVAQIVNNTDFGKINTLISQGRDMDLPLV